jgi:hypothetical protein
MVLGEVSLLWSMGHFAIGMLADLTRNHSNFMGTDDNRLDANLLGDNRPPLLPLHGGGRRVGWHWS